MKAPSRGEPWCEYNRYPHNLHGIKGTSLKMLWTISAISLFSNSVRDHDLAYGSFGGGINPSGEIVRPKNLLCSELARLPGISSYADSRTTKPLPTQGECHDANYNRYPSHSSTVIKGTSLCYFSITSHQPRSRYTRGGPWCGEIKAWPRSKLIPFSAFLQREKGAAGKEQRQRDNQNSVFLFQPHPPRYCRRTSWWVDTVLRIQG